MKLSTLFLSAACLAAAAGPALAQSRVNPPAPTQSRFSYSSDGSEATDSKTGLVWRRCAEGMAWNGSTCTGTARQFTHEAALVQAKSQTGWRLPSVQELASIVDRSRSNPAIDAMAFPVTPPEWFWTASPHAGDSAQAWFVYFYNGYIGPGTRSVESLRVRLVR